MRRVLSLLVLSFALSTLLAAQNAGTPSRLIGLLDSAQVIRDTNGIAHIRASNDHDLMFLQGYTHAQDRLFQMDVLRRAGSGTLAELVGTAALARDVQARTLGLRRAAVRSLPLQSPRAQAMLQAYADGVNAYVANHPLPPEYAALGITQFDPWQPLDTLTIGKALAWQLNYNITELDFSTALLSYQQAGAVLGFDGTKLFFEDLDRSAPFDPAATIPDASASSVAPTSKVHPGAWPKIDPQAGELVKRYLDAIKGLEFFDNLRKAKESGFSNAWAVSGKFTTTGAPLMANDPHVDLTYPPIWYPIHLSAGELDVIGNSLPGTPLVILGHNRWISWGTTTQNTDLTDWYLEQIVPDGSSPSGLSTVYKGTLEHIIPIPETFRARIGGQLVTIPPGGGIPAATLIVPRRNNGPIVGQFGGGALSMQWTGFSGTRDLEAFLRWAEARNPADFESGLRVFTMPQNFLYIDRQGNFAYYNAGEVPVREDLQAGTVTGAPPYLLRNGQGGNEWLPVVNPQPEQSLPYEILPFSEMPHILNPPAGWVVNANNDPVGITLENNPLGTLRPGGGIYYLGYNFNPGQRAGRITELLQEKLQSGKVSFEDMQKIQADTALGEARFFVPFITQALDNARRNGAPPQLAALGMDAALAEAVGRLQTWDLTTPTGIPEGYDAFEVAGQQPSTAEISNSVAATIYVMWRSEFAKSVIDSRLTPYSLPLPASGQTLTALRHLLETFSTNQGVGTSGINFFSAPGVASAADRREIYILQAVRSALTLLASDNFKNAFNNSTNQNDYRWGKLHRLVLAHPLGSVFSVPTAGGMFPPPLPSLTGIPVDGGPQTVDASLDPFRINNENGAVSTFGPSERSVAEALPNGVRGVSALYGGVSGVLGSPLYINLLPQYLVNGAYEQLFRMSELQGSIQSIDKYEP